MHKLLQLLKNIFMFLGANILKYLNSSFKIIRVNSIIKLV